LVKADLGTKRVCPSCGARFYDLSKRPIECPKCHFAFEPETMFKQRRPRQPEPVAAEQPVVETEEEEVEETTEAEEPIVEPVEGAPVIETSGEEADEEETTVEEEPETPDAGMSVVEGEEAAIEDIEGEEVGRTKRTTACSRKWKKTKTTSAALLTLISKRTSVRIVASPVPAPGIGSGP
jgi:uncharacterized protein (TIGR02300 family)